MSVIEDLLLRLRATGWREGAAEVDATSGAIKKSAVAADEATASHSKLGGALSSLKGAALKTAGVAGIAGLGAGLFEAIKTSDELQASQRLLGETIDHNVRKPAADATEQMTKYAESLSARGGFSPMDAIAGMTTLVRATGSVTKAQKDLALATNMARGGHMDLARATRSVGLVEQGHTAGLTRLGVVLPTITKAEDALAAAHGTASHAATEHAKALDAAATKTADLAALQRKFAGDTRTYSKSAQGAMSNLTNQVEILGMGIGKVLLPIIGAVARALGQFIQGMRDGKGVGGAFVGVLKSIVGAFEDVWGWIKKNKDMLIEMGAALAPLVIAWGVYKGVMLAALVVQRAMVIGMAALDAVMDANPIMLVVAGIAALVLGLIYAYNHVKWFRDAVQDAFHWVLNAIKNVWNWVKHNWPLLAAILLGPFGLIMGQIVEHFATIKKAATDAAQWISNAFNNVVQFFSKLPGRLASAGKDMWSWIKTAFQNVLSWLMGAWNSLLDKMNVDIGPIHIHPGASLKFSQSSIASTRFGKSSVRAVGGGQGAPPILMGNRQGGGPIWRGGQYLVGERGPEIVTLPGGSNVTPNEALHGARGQPPIVLYNVLDGKILSQSIVRQGLLQQSRGG
jgi:hypothetical protein